MDLFINGRLGEAVVKKHIEAAGRYWEGGRAETSLKLGSFRGAWSAQCNSDPGDRS